MQPTDPIEQHFRLNPLQRAGLKKRGIATLEQLLRHFPSRYETQAPTRTIQELTPKEKVTIVARVVTTKISKAYFKKIPMAEVTLDDGTGTIKAIWYHQAYMAKKVQEGKLARVSGTVAERKGQKYIANPEIEEARESDINPGNLFGEAEIMLFPVYPESRGISSSWFYHAIQKLIRAGLPRTMHDRIPSELLAKYHLPALETAIVWIHSPKDSAKAEAARKRFAFEEIFFIQLGRQKSKLEYQVSGASVVPYAKGNCSTFLKRFPFPPTKAQSIAIETILSDMAKPKPMCRLLEGDVGSGKTLVAACAAYSAVSATRKGQPLQAAYMAPTEILARQHFESFIKYFAHLELPIGLITGTSCRKFPSKISPDKHTDISRTQLLKWAASGELSILIGTHALIQKSVKFKNLALTIIDEQHRFGTKQRSKLVHNHSVVPHLLSMTATPIPRTLALTVYGDLDLTLLDEMPPGRKPIITEIISPTGRENLYEKVRAELRAGRQLYVICPRIDEPDPTKELALQARSAKEETKRLKNDVFPEYKIEVLHSKMRPDEKEGVMTEFLAGNINILVATSVVEVGVNVPNATNIIIEGAERFGLAQLHQLRGRVVRSTHQAYCYIMTDTKSGKSMERLKALKDARNGFELAELDLALRGPGELGGIKQWGISDIGMEAIKNIKMVEAARTETQAILKKDPNLNNYPDLASIAESRSHHVHFE